MRSALAMGIVLVLGACDSDPSGLSCGSERETSFLTDARGDEAKGWRQILDEFVASVPADSVVGVAIGVGETTKREVEAALEEAGGTDIYWFYSIPTVVVYLPAGNLSLLANRDWVYHMSIVRPGTTDATRDPCFTRTR